MVVGGGVVGAAAALAAARRGLRVALLEAGSLEVARGSSAGRTRIFSPAAYPDDSYLERGLRALALWREIERATGEQLLWTTGALSMGAFAERELPALRAAGVASELLSRDQAMRRFGVAVPDDRPILYQPDAGVLRSDRARQLLLELAADTGAHLVEHEEVRALAEDGDEVVAQASDASLRASSAIVTAGAWSRALLARTLQTDLPLEASCQSVVYLRMDDPGHPPVALMEFEGDEPFAVWDPLYGLKAALHVRGPYVPSPPGQLEVGEEVIHAVVEWVQERLPDRRPERAAVEPCLYTSTPNEQFILRREGRIVIGAACNGQGFQFAPDTGEELAALAAEPILSEPRAGRG